MMIGSLNSDKGLQSNARKGGQEKGEFRRRGACGGHQNCTLGRWACSNLRTLRGKLGVKGNVPREDSGTKSPL